VTSARWPASLLLIRHAESVGNVARNEAEASGLSLIDIAVRDMDVELSNTGVEQAAQLGASLADRTAPAAVYSSPYLRAAATAEIACQAAGFSVPVTLDERLREREFGILDRLTRAGIEARFPQEAEARRRVGKFYYRPPGGESWCDVALRVRSAVDTLGRAHPGEHVIVVAHEVVVMMFRYVLERLTEAEVLALGAAGDLPNCSVTEFRHSTTTDAPGMDLVSFAALPVQVPLTVEADVPRAPR
jgi:broad specificity phosphatase PhoE